MSFNSRPREEATIHLDGCEKELLMSFNSRPREEATL